jgi:hypothetical protein
MLWVKTKNHPAQKGLVFDSIVYYICANSRGLHQKEFVSENEPFLERNSKALSGCKIIFQTW